MCAVLGWLGPARTLGATTMMTTEGARLGIPQGQLASDCANMAASVRVAGLVAFGQLYAAGVRLGVPQLAYVVLGATQLTAAALASRPAVWRADDGEEEAEE